MELLYIDKKERNLKQNKIYTQKSYGTCPIKQGPYIRHLRPWIKIMRKNVVKFVRLHQLYIYKEDL